jgi:threonine dehydrogenase-like Zn-dependent dehydrogenase
MARAQGAEVVDFEEEDPVKTIRDLTLGIGVDRCIDAVGVDANRAHHGPAGRRAKRKASDFDEQIEKVAPETHPDGDNWLPGDGPSQVLDWAVDALAKAGTLSIIGVYSEASDRFPIGRAVEKNLTMKMGNCPHRRFVPELVEMVRMRRVDPAKILTQQKRLGSAIDAYRAFDRREAGWTKVELVPSRENGHPSRMKHVSRTV